MRAIPIPIRKRILELYDRGRSTREIAQFSGFCVAAVRRVRQQFGARGTLEPWTYLCGRKTLLTEERKQRLQQLLAEQPDSVISRRRLMQHLWSSEYVGDEHACEVHISNLRRKIERDPSEPQRLVTVRGLGYKLIPA